jgi:hypothetical protein
LFYDFAEQNLHGSYNGDFGYYSPSVGTNLCAFSKDCYADDLKGRCNGSEGAFVFDGVDDAQDLVDFISQFPCPLIFYVPAWSQRYIMHDEWL